MTANNDELDGMPPEELNGGGVQNTPDEEALDIGGVSDKTEKSETVNPDRRNFMESRAADLHDISTPGEDVDSFIDKLIAVSGDQLIPWEQCFLPSMGLYYDGDWEDGSVKVRAMGQQAEKILATQRLAQSGQSMDYLFRQCCDFPDGFDPINLLLGDRVFLLYFLRGITHGNQYEFAFTCPNPECGAVSTHRYDLNELSTTIAWANPDLGPEPFSVNLPYLSEAFNRDVWVSVRFLRAYDANDILARRKSKNKVIARPGNTVRTRGQQKVNQGVRNQTQQLDDSITDNLEKVIVDIMGSSDRLKIRQLVSNMHARDTSAIREWLRKNTPGIDNSVIVGCPECGADHTVELPITESFFRPTK